MPVGILGKLIVILLCFSDVLDDDTRVLELHLGPAVHLPHCGSATVPSWLSSFAWFLNRSMGVADGGVLVLQQVGLGCLLAWDSADKHHLLCSWAADGEKRLVVSDPEQAAVSDSQDSSEKDFGIGTLDDGGIDVKSIARIVQY